MTVWGWKGQNVLQRRATDNGKDSANAHDLTVESDLQSGDNPDVVREQHACPEDG